MAESVVIELRGKDELIVIQVRGKGVTSQNDLSSELAVSPVKLEVDFTNNLPNLEQVIGIAKI